MVEIIAEPPRVRTAFDPDTHAGSVGDVRRGLFSLGKQAVDLTAGALEDSGHLLLLLNGGRVCNLSHCTEQLIQ